MADPTDGRPVQSTAAEVAWRSTAPREIGRGGDLSASAPRLRLSKSGPILGMSRDLCFPHSLICHERLSCEHVTIVPLCACPAGPPLVCVVASL